MNEITTKQQLDKFLGQVLHFSYISGGIRVEYMKKIMSYEIPLYKIDKNLEQDIKQLMFYGKNTVILKSQYKYRNKPFVQDYEHYCMNNEYDTIRMPTKEEMNLYMQLLRRKRCGLD